MLYVTGRSKRFLISLSLLSILSPAKSLNVKTFPYSIFNMEADTESLLKLSENSEQTTEPANYKVNRRGYAGDDFYQKASKSIPRIGRRGGVSPETTCNCKSTAASADFENSHLEKTAAEQNLEKIKRPYLLPDGTLWPWHTDRVPNYPKRREPENCYYLPKIESFVTDFEFCNDDFICCPPAKDVSSTWKRFIQTYPNKQTLQKPNYKNNQYM